MARGLLTIHHAGLDPARLFAADYYIVCRSPQT
jgi:hypothetical protein